VTGPNGPGYGARPGQHGDGDFPRDDGQSGEGDRRERRIRERQPDEPQLVQAVAMQHGRAAHPVDVQVDNMAWLRAASAQHTAADTA
jgi:hypothetical protein